MIKYYSLLLLCISINVFTFAQKSNLVFFTENEEKFILIVNGIQQNVTPLSNIVLTDLTAPNRYKVRVKFEDARLPMLTDNVFVNEFVEKTLLIRSKKNKAGMLEYAFKFYSETQITSDSRSVPSNPNQLIVYHSTPVAGTFFNDDVSMNVSIGGQTAGITINTSGNNTVSTNTVGNSNTTIGNSTSTNNTRYAAGCISPLNQLDFNNQLNRVKSQNTAAGKQLVAENIARTNCLTSQQVYQLCDALYLSSNKLDLAKFCYLHCYDPQNYEEVYKAMPTSSMVKELNDYILSVSVQVNPTPQPIPQQVPVVVYVPGYNGPIGCPQPMSRNDFAAVKATIQDADFENTKLSTAQSILASNCLTTDQVVEICRLFDFENTKLDFAKFAYSKTYDSNNYFKVNVVFDFDSSKEALNEFVKNGGN